MADVKKSLVSVAKLVKNGNWTILEDVEVKIKGETIAFGSQYQTGETGTSTLVSSVGVRAWPSNKLKKAAILPKKPGSRTRAASG